MATDATKSRLEVIRRTAFEVRRERPRPTLADTLDRINRQLAAGGYDKLSGPESHMVATFMPSILEESLWTGAA